MKLSLWMVANRLEQYDIETMISPTTERTLGGPLPFSAVQSICVRKEGSGVVCSSEQGVIRIHGVTEDEGFLLIQSIFNWYDEWFEKIEATLRRENYRRYVHLCAQAFGNPVLLLDANKFLTGMDCRGMELDAIPEWRYIAEKGQVSAPYYTMMTRVLSDPVRRYRGGVLRFLEKPGRGERDGFGGLHARFQYSSSDYGSITVLDRKRPLTLGDVALLELLADRSSVLFAARDRGSDGHSDTLILNELLDFKPVPKERLELIRSVVTAGAAGGGGDLCLFLFRYDVEKGREGLQNLLRNIIIRRYPSVFSWSYRDDFLVLSNAPDIKLLAHQLLSFVAAQGYSQNLRVAASLPFEDLQDIPYFYEQAVFAAGRLSASGFCDFYDCAGAYLLETADRKRRLYACEPYCRRAWRASPESRKNLETLAVYLENERASAMAADKLFIHKNTLSYRVRNIKELSGWDLDNPVLRDYLRLSVYFLSQSDSLL